MFPLSKWHAVWVAGIVAITAVVAWPAFRHHARSPAGPVQVTSATMQSPTPPSQPARITPVASPLYVHVTGQVARPGLYRMPPGSRVMDAITGAGGATADADLDALNLATPLRDGQKLLVPRFGEPPSPPTEGYLSDSPAAPEPQPVCVRADPPAASSPAAEPAYEPPATTSASTHSATAKLKHPGDGTVAINHASLTELQRLPGVGPATAARIAEYRDSHGGFQTVDELMEVKGIGEKKLAKMRPFVVID